MTRRILGIDPGPRKSGIALLETSASAHDPVGPHNSRLVSSSVPESSMLLMPAAFAGADAVAIEMIGFQGSTPGGTTFWTLELIGRIASCWELSSIMQGRGMDFQEALEGATPVPAKHILRTRVRAHLCGSRGNDSLVKQALAERFGRGSAREAKGLKKSPGPLYGIKSHAWQALAVAVALAEGVKTETPPWERGDD